MNLENTRVQMRKGILEFCVLHVISRGEIYASELLEELTQARLITVEGTLYPLLNRLTKAGLVEYFWQESTAGPPRKYYRLTKQGAEFLEGLRNTWNQLKNSTEHILNNDYTNKDSHETE